MISRRFGLVLNLIIVLCAGVGPVWGRVFLTGSNPALTVFAFPQDILLMPGETVFYYGSYQILPWWGDIDEPENKPNKKYALTGEKTDEWRHNQSINQFTNLVGFTKFISDSSKVRFDLDYTSSHLRADASGSGNAQGPSYTYHESHAIRNFYLNSVLATHYNGVPIGAKIGLGVEITSKPDVEHFINDGQRSAELLWGWDGENYWTQDNYNLGSLFRFDAQLAATLRRGKLGGRFRLYHGTLDRYDWNGGQNRPDKINNRTLRLYGIYNWYEQNKFKFNTTVLSRYTYVDSIGVSAANQANETGEVQKAKQFVFQINPNVNIYPWPYPMTYIDAAILCNFSHTTYDHVQNYYVGGGMQEGHINTGIWSDDDYSWERFSWAKENFFELAFDVNATVPIIGMKNQNVALGITMFLWQRYKWLTKYFGKTNVLPNDLAFSIEKVRHNLDKETWLNSIVNIIYRRDKYMFRLDIGQPIIYSQTPRTRITDGAGNIIYEMTRDKMWLSQSGIKVGLFVSTSLENFRSYRLWRTFDKQK
jgi:hypothetical protein